ncbi:MAG TPA: hypothetical protein VEV39_05585 [Gemmatimonadales bacterium]|nr:hypothetical protein [Gemmatimonadales bacterium]
MSTRVIFLSQLLLGYLAWLLYFRSYRRSKVQTQDPATTHRNIASLHSFRFFGLALLLPGLVGPELPARFVTVAAYGDFATGLLALLALLTARKRPLFQLFVVLFNLVGVADILVDYVNAVRLDLPSVAGQLGALYAIPVLYVPALMITHIVAFSLLLRPAPAPARAVI